MAISFRKFFSVFLINFFLLLFLLELIFVAYYFVQDGQYYSVKQKIEKDNQESLFEPDAVACKKSNKFGEHPYLAYVHISVPECDYHINNTGHRGDNFPQKKDPSKYVVLFTGGSAALQLANMASPSLGERLKNELNIEGKEIVFLNGAMEGWKQPQQLILIMQHLSVVDLVIAYEGFNELTISRQHEYKLDLDVPALGLYRKGRLDRGANISATFYQNYQSLLYENFLFKHSKTAYFFGEYLALKLNSVANQEGEGYLQEKFPEIFYLPDDWSYEQRRDHLINKYLSYIQSIHAASAQKTIPYLHFIQPVPALAKKLTVEEEQGAADISYDKDYLLLEKSLLALKRQGVQVFSLVNVFSETEDRVYKDAVHLRMETAAPQQVMDKIIVEVRQAAASALNN